MVSGLMGLGVNGFVLFLPSVQDLGVFNIP